MDEQKKEASEQEIKKCVKEYVSAALNFLLFGYCEYPKMKCPVPGCDGEVRYDENSKWNCLRWNCRFVIPEHLVPPNFNAIRDAHMETERAQYILATQKRISEILAKF